VRFATPLTEKAPSPRLRGVTSVPPRPAPSKALTPRLGSVTRYTIKSSHPRLGGVAKHIIKSSQPPSRGRHKRTTLPSGTKARSLFSREHRQAPIQRLPAPVSGASMSAHPRPRARGRGAFSDSGASSSTHHRPFKGSQPPSRGRHKRTTLPSGTKARSLFSREHRQAPIQRLPAPVSGALMSMHPRPRGRRRGAFSDSRSSSSTHHRPFKGSQPPSRGR